MSTVEALKHAEIDQSYIDEHELGIIYGNDSSAQPVIDAIDIIRETKDTMMVGSGNVFQVLNSTVNMNLATIFSLKGINFTVSAACASGSHSIGLAAMFIRNGMQDCIVCGGAQEMNVYSMGNFDALGAFSIREDNPAGASRPFDKSRDGLVPSGGAATVILESLESAQRRDAKILGEVIGYGFSSNGEHISNPSVEGPARSLRMALKNSGLRSNEIDYVNAHATATPAGGTSETRANFDVLGDSKTPVSSTKSIT